jgi:excisionase family DNA binding protein
MTDVPLASYEVYDEHEAAKYVGLSVRTLQEKRRTGEGPVYLKLGSRVRYRRRALDVWLDSKERRRTSETV